MKKNVLKAAMLIALALTCLVAASACKAEPANETENATQTAETKTVEVTLSADEIRAELRKNCDGTFKDAKRIFDEKYSGQEFRMEYFFTQYELNTIKVLEDNGKNKVDYESYNKGWVKIESLVGEVGDDQTYVGEQDPFVENFIWQ